MQNNKKKSIFENQIIAAFFIILLGMLIAFRFDYYYDLNDDLVMKDIVAGVYTGLPDGHNIQMLYPVSWLISMCYRIIRSISWYGIFMITCQFGCLFLIAGRTARYFESIWSKCAAVAAELVVIGAFFLYELVFAQYTVTAALLGATAAFLLYTTEQGLPWKDFIKQNIISIVMVIIAYQIRTEMLLLLFPIICVVGICKWAREEQIFSRDNFKKYLIIIGIILTGMLVSEGINKIAYGDAEWKSFQSLFDSRTELYDFQSIPEYEEHQEFYESIGLQRSEQELFENYNFGFDEKINEHTMKAVADYARENRLNGQTFVSQLKDSIKKYFYMVFSEKEELPWNQFVILAYILAFVLALSARKYSFLWKLPLLACTRSVLWLYIIYLNRYPSRITHSLYIMELLVLCGMMLELRKEVPKSERNNTVLRILAEIPFAVICIISILYLSSGVRYVQTEYNKRETVNAEYLALQSYCAEHADQVYLLDVYSTVAYSEKMFTGAENQLANYEYLGGWVSKSPIDRDKLKASGIATIEEAACNQDNVFIISHISREIDWLNFYLQEQGYEKEAKKVDEIITHGNISFNVYQIADIDI